MTSPPFCSSLDFSIIDSSQLSCILAEGTLWGSAWSCCQPQSFHP